jgi:hypothetical protein
MSIIAAPFVIAARTAKIKDPRKALRLTLKHMVYYGAFWVVAMRYIYPRLH